LLWIVTGTEAVVVIALVFVVAGILRYLSAIQERLDSSVRRVSRLERGATIPEVRLPEVKTGRLKSLTDLVGSQRTMVMLLNDSCQSCDVLIRQIGELAARPGGLDGIGWRFVLAWIGEQKVVVAKAAALPVTEHVIHLMDADGELARSLLIGSFPVGMAFDSAGRLESQSAQPGPNWLYLTLRVPGPDRPIDQGLAPRAVLRTG